MIRFAQIDSYTILWLIMRNTVSTGYTQKVHILSVTFNSTF